MFKLFVLRHSYNFQKSILTTPPSSSHITFLNFVKSSALLIKNVIHHCLETTTVLMVVSTIWSLKCLFNRRCFERVFLKPSTNRPLSNWPTNHLPMTTGQVHRPPNNRPSTNKKYDDQKFHNKF